MTYVSSAQKRRNSGLYTPETICYTDDKRQNNLPFTRSICIKAGIRIPIITVPVVKDHIRKAGDYVTLEEQRQAAIMNYVNLMRIKACETGTNKELDYQIKVARVILSNFGIDISELDL